MNNKVKNLKEIGKMERKMWKKKRRKRRKRVVMIEELFKERLLLVLGFLKGYINNKDKNNRHYKMCNNSL